jgi:putative ABC transport system permease protein
MKKWLSPFSTAWIGVATHKLRSFLTILGVVIGVAAVITLMSIGKGTSARILSSFQDLGSNLLFISPGAVVTSGNVKTMMGSAESLTLEDAEAISQQVANVEVSAPSETTFMQIIAGSENIGSMITGVTPDYQDIYKLKLSSGYFIQQNQYDSAQKVAVLGSGVKEYLFGDDDPVGQPIRIGSTVWRIIGVLESKGQSFGMGSNDNAIIIPLTTLQQMVTKSRTTSGGHIVGSLTVSVTDEKYLSQVTSDITGLLRFRHQLSLSDDDDFSITSVEQLTSSITQATDTLTLLLGAIAAISLLVGGIGVMNIMLVSVIERTREIGIRKALGARERDIWGQFVIEAAFMTLVGGAIGILIGWGASRIISRFTQMPTLVSPDIVVLAVSVSAGIGLFFGFYPAWQASRLNPIQALRHE